MAAVKGIAKEVARSLIPILCIIIILQVFFIKPQLSDYLTLLIGVGLTAVGMFLYQLGAKLGLLPIGNAIGSGMYSWGRTILIVLVFLTIGLAVTLSEPNVMVMGELVEEMTEGQVSSELLSISLATGAGIMLVIAIFCIFKQVSFKVLYMIGYGVVLILSFFTSTDFVSMAFDAGGFSSGLISNPFILTTGLGIASLFVNRRGVTATGFGIIGFTAIGPILAVMIIGLFV